jgi:hypothetical protein
MWQGEITTNGSLSVACGIYMALIKGGTFSKAILVLFFVSFCRKSINKSAARYLGTPPEVGMHQPKRRGVLPMTIWAFLLELTSLSSLFFLLHQLNWRVKKCANTRSPCSCRVDFGTCELLWWPGWPLVLLRAHMNCICSVIGHWCYEEHK